MSKYTVDEVIEICKKYKEMMKDSPYYHASTPTNYIDIAEQLKILGREWGDMAVSQADFAIRKGYCITNNGSGHIPSQDEWYIIWNNGNIGVYQFINRCDNDYDYVQEEWKEFKNKLMSYNPINYDPYNTYIVYDIKNGNKLLDDYCKIVEETKEKIKKKLNQLELTRAKERYEKLLKQREDADGDGN